jgi:hypothetical protein
MPDANTPQFNTAEYAGQPGTDRCHYCQQTIGARYYRVNNRMACPACTEKAALAVPQESHAAFMRAMLFGAGAAIAGMALYAVVEIATGFISSIFSLAAGWMVAKAMMAGSKGQGGRSYQIAAALLTYAAISLAAIPVFIFQYKSPGTLITAHLGRLAVFGLTSPFLDLFMARSPVALIALVILFLGIRIAWKIAAGTRASEIIGPFSTSRPASA